MVQERQKLSTKIYAPEPTLKHIIITFRQDKS